MTHWSPVAVNALLIKSWPDDDLAVAYNRVNGDTHVLEPLALELISSCTERPQTVAMLTADLAADLAPMSHEEIAQRVSQTLEQLGELGLLIKTSL